VNPFKMVLDFWRIGHPDKIAEEPSFPDEEMRELNLKLIEEEFKELILATGQDDIVETADAIVDLIYVTIGMAITHGIPIEEVFAEVHRTNMAKFPDGKVTLNHYGKIMKPEGWEPPNIERILSSAEGSR
jgi:phosphoribosyl-ATP pyrophosphohydrolase